MWDFPLFPDQASTIAQQIDLVYYVLVALAAFFGIGVAVVLVYLAVKYRAGAEVDRSNPVTDNLKLEMIWMLGPLGLAIGMFVWGSVVYFDVQTPPSEEPIEIYVVGKQWMWKFQHTSGVREINTLHVPTGRPIKMIMTSQDVIHSFYVPAFRVKQDVLPGRFSNLWFEATKPGDYQLFCAEYCGTQHSRMEGKVRVMEPQAYERWLRLGDTEDAELGERTGRYRRPDRMESAPPAPGAPAESISGETREMAAAGAALFGTLRCNTCHRTDSSATTPSTGPVLEDVFGRRVQLRNEREIVADEQYLLESILYPYAKLVQGYPAIMPPYAGQVSQTELSHLVAYLKSLSDEPAALDTAAADTAAANPVAAGEELFTRMACDTCHRVSPGAAQPTTGPPLYRISGREVRLQSGETVTADESYLRRSILRPQEDVVEGFQPVMPAYEGRLSDTEVDHLIAYLTSLQ